MSIWLSIPPRAIKVYDEFKKLFAMKLSKTGGFYSVPTYTSSLVASINVKTFGGPVELRYTAGYFLKTRVSARYSLLASYGKLDCNEGWNRKKAIFGLFVKQRRR